MNKKRIPKPVKEKKVLKQAYIEEELLETLDVCRGKDKVTFRTVMEWGAKQYIAHFHPDIAAKMGYKQE